MSLWRAQRPTLPGLPGVRMVGVVDCGLPVVVDCQLAVLPAGAEEETGAKQDEARGVALHVGVVRSVGQTLPATLRVQAFLQAPEHDVAVIIPRDQPGKLQHLTMSSPIISYSILDLSLSKSSVRTLFSSFKTLRQIPTWISVFIVKFSQD